MRDTFAISPLIKKKIIWHRQSRRRGVIFNEKQLAITRFLWKSKRLPDSKLGWEGCREGCKPLVSQAFAEGQERWRREGLGCLHRSAWSSASNVTFKRKGSPWIFPYWQGDVTVSSEAYNTPNPLIHFTSFMFSEWLLHIGGQILWSVYESAWFIHLTSAQRGQEPSSMFLLRHIFDALEFGAWDGKWYKHGRWSSCFTYWPNTHNAWCKTICLYLLVPSSCLFLASTFSLGKVAFVSFRSRSLSRAMSEAFWTTRAS